MSEPVITARGLTKRYGQRDAVSKLTGCEGYAVAAFSSVAAYRGTIGLSGELPQVVQALTASGKPVVLIALGNPYLLRSFPDVPAYLATFSTATSSETRRPARRCHRHHGSPVVRRLHRASRALRIWRHL